MKVLLCARNELLLSRWESALKNDAMDIVKAGSLVEIMSHVENKGEVPIIILHQPWADLKRLAVLQKRYPLAAIIILSDSPNTADGVSFLNAGVVGFGNAYMNPERLRSVVDIVSSKGVWVGQDLMQKLISNSYRQKSKSEDAGKSDVLNHLTEREMQVAMYISEGISNKEIAQHLSITERTVKAHLNSIYRKTGVKSRLPLALLVQELG